MNGEHPGWLASLVACELAVTGWALMALAWPLSRLSELIGDLSEITHRHAQEILDGVPIGWLRMLGLMANLCVWAAIFLLIAWVLR